MMKYKPKGPTHQVSAQDIDPLSSLLNPKDMYNNTKPMTLTIQMLGPPSEKAEAVIRPHKDKYFQLAHHSFDNISSASKITGPTGNSFYDALYLAWVSHGELVLCPDDFWIQIAIETATIIDKHAEELRKINASHAGKMKLIVQTSNEECFKNWKSPEYRWDAVISVIGKQINSDMKSNLAKPFLKPFSTTGLIEQSLSEICLMHSYRKYYEYVHMDCVCGFTKVHYLGKNVDWDLLIEKAKTLEQYGSHTKLSELTDYLGKIIPVLKSIRDGFDQKLDLNFWNSVFIKNYKVPEEYGIFVPEEGYILDGWANVFLSNKVESLKDVKARYVKAPLELVDCKGKSEKVMLMGGFSGILRNTQAFRPVMTIGISGECEQVEQFLRVKTEKYHL